MTQIQPAWFFDSEARRNRLLQELMAWENTRFVAGVGENAKPGVAADCVSAVEKVLVRMRAIPPIHWPRYVIRGGGEEMLMLLVQQLARVPGLKRIATLLPGDALPELMVGDVLLCSSGRAHHHLALYIGGNNVWHFTEQAHGPTRTNIQDVRFARLIRAVYRVTYEKPTITTEGR